MLDKIAHLLLRPSLIHLLPLAYLPSLEQGDNLDERDSERERSRTAVVPAPASRCRFAARRAAEGAVEGRFCAAAGAGPDSSLSE